MNLHDKPMAAEGLTSYRCLPRMFYLYAAKAHALKSTYRGLTSTQWLLKASPVIAQNAPR